MWASRDRRASVHVRPNVRSQIASDRGRTAKAASRAASRGDAITRLVNGTFTPWPGPPPEPPSPPALVPPAGAPALTGVALGVGDELSGGTDGVAGAGLSETGRLGVATAGGVGTAGGVTGGAEGVVRGGVTAAGRVGVGSAGREGVGSGETSAALGSNRPTARLEVVVRRRPAQAAPAASRGRAQIVLTVFRPIADWLWAASRCRTSRPLVSRDSRQRRTAWLA